jgi:hypothetical protein
MSSIEKDKVEISHPDEAKQGGISLSLPANKDLETLFKPGTQTEN